ncbi:MAG: hypothetical protein JNK90_04685, partial [Planctomycetaceae bacterium]|nr:hypothetical protein [Planctomycetaceae bacterium]
MTARAASVEWAQKPELQEERQEILNDAILFYQGLIADESDSLEVRREASKAYALLSGTHFVLNDLAAAQKAAEECIQLCQELQKREPENLEYSARIAQMISLVGTIHSLNGDNELAWQQVTAGSKLIREVADKTPQQIEYQIQALESMSYLAYAGISSGSENAKLVTNLLAEMEIKIKHLLDNFRATYKRQVAIAFAYNVKAAYKNLEQKPEEAVELYRSAIDLLKTIKDQDAPDARSADQFLQTWAICHLNYGISGSSSGEMISEQNLKDIDEGLEYSRLLLQCHPKAYVFRMQLMQALRVKGAALAKLDRTAESTEVINESNQVLQELMKDNPKQPWVLS